MLRATISDSDCDRPLFLVADIAPKTFIYQFPQIEVFANLLNLLLCSAARERRTHRTSGNICDPKCEVILRMANWMIELGGERFDLQELLRIKSLPDTEVREEDGRFYLTGSVFNSFIEARDVLNHARNALRIINGIAQLEIQNWENVEVIGVARNEDNGTRTQFIFPDPIRGRSRVSGNLTVIGADGVPKSTTQKDALESFLEIARKDSGVEKALRIYGSREHSWSNLYIIYEIIEADIGGKTQIINRGWATSKRIELFKRTANSLTAAGDDARHGKENKQPPSSPMQLSQANEMIEHMLKEWLRTK